jgi:FkbM family methyltransferase
MKKQKLVSKTRTVPARLVESAHMAVQKCRHGTFMYNVNDQFIGRSLDLYGDWCDDESFVLGQVLAPGGVVVDAGANIGTHTVFFAKAVDDQGLVVAFEPQRLVFQNLCKNVALNGLRNVQCVMAAVGDARGRLTFPAIDPGRSFNFGAVKASADGAGETVDVIPIDELDLQRCDLIKVDVEGMEAKAIAGATQTIERCRPVLYLENDTVERSRGVLEAVASVVYKDFWHIAPYYTAKNFFGNEDNVFGHFQSEANVFCVPKEAPMTGLVAVEGLEDDWTKAVGRMSRERDEGARWRRRLPRRVERVFAIAWRWSMGKFAPLVMIRRQAAVRSQPGREAS